MSLGTLGVQTCTVKRRNLGSHSDVVEVPFWVQDLSREQLETSE